MWIFGYGSLIWRPGFDFLERRKACVHGRVRRFWQGSSDHRGTPEAPGRVVTLVPDEGVCWGAAFRLDPTDDVLAALDHREKGGYERLELEVVFEAGKATALTWVAPPENPSYLGPAPIRAIAEQVVASVGPSGANVEYVLELDRALRRMGAPDPHVGGVARAVRELTGADRI